MSEDNGCFYRYAWNGCGRCSDDPADKTDRYGNKFCLFHKNALPYMEEAGELAKRQNITFTQALDVVKSKRRFDHLRSKMQIKRTIRHIDQQHPDVEDVVTHIPLSKMAVDEIRAGFEKGTLKKATFELADGYIIIYEKLDD